MTFNANQVKVLVCLRKFRSSTYKALPIQIVITASFVIVNYIKYHDIPFATFNTVLFILLTSWFIFNAYRVSKLINKIIVHIDIEANQINCATTGISVLVFIKNEPLNLQFNKNEVLFKESTEKYPFADEFNTGIWLLISEGNEYLLLPSVYDNFQDLKSVLDSNINL